MTWRQRPLLANIHSTPNAIRKSIAEQSGRGRKAHADRVEVLKRVAPDARLVRGVTAVALIRDDEVERVDWNIEGVSIVLDLAVATRLRERSLRTEKIPRHALDGGDIDERVAHVGRGQVFVGQQLRIERVVIAEILALKPLTIELVFLGELVALRCIERIELPHSLRRERLAIHEKEDPAHEL
jgi:hypothetical protein